MINRIGFVYLFIVFSWCIPVSCMIMVPFALTNDVSPCPPGTCPYELLKDWFHVLVIVLAVARSVLGPFLGNESFSSALCL